MRELIFPPRNLPGGAVAWARETENALQRVHATNLNLGQTFDNSGVSSAGQLAVIANNVNEIYLRSPEIKELTPMSVTGSATAEPYPRSNQTVTFDPSPEKRNAFVTVSGRVTSSPQINGVRMYVYLMYKGDVAAFNFAIPVAGASTPLEWLNNDSLFAFGTVSIPAGESPQFTVRAVRAADPFSPGSSTLTLEGPVVTLSRSGIQP